MGNFIKKLYSNNLAKNASIEVSQQDKNTFPEALIDGNMDTFWTTPDWQEKATIEIKLPKLEKFNVVMLQEHLQSGQRIESFNIQIFQRGKWTQVAKGTTVGYRRLIKFITKNSDKIRIEITGSRFAPTLAEIGVFRDY